MMNGNATVFMEHLCFIPHSSQFVRPMNRHIGGLLFVKSIFDPTEGTNKKFLQMLTSYPPAVPPRSGHLEIAQLMLVSWFCRCNKIIAVSSSPVPFIRSPLPCSRSL